MKIYFIFEDGYSYIGTKDTKFNIINKLKQKHGGIAYICKA